MWWSKRKQNLVVVSSKVKEKPVVTCITYISLCKKMFENLKRTKKGWELFLKGLMIIGNKKMFSISFFFFHTYKNTFYVYKCYSSALLSPLSSFFMGFINLSLSSLGFIESHQLHIKKKENNHFTNLQLYMHYRLQSTHNYHKHVKCKCWSLRLKQLKPKRKRKQTGLMSPFQMQWEAKNPMTAGTMYNRAGWNKGKRQTKTHQIISHQKKGCRNGS